MSDPFKIEDFLKLLNEYEPVDYIGNMYRNMSPAMRKALDEACIEYIKLHEGVIEERTNNINPIQVPKNIAHDIANLHFKTK